jgi:hypothetical protein
MSRLAVRPIGVSDTVHPDTLNTKYLRWCEEREICRTFDETIGTISVPGSIDVGAVTKTLDEDYDYVLPGMLSASVAMLAAPGGTGKTLLLMQAAISIAARDHDVSFFGGAWDAPDGRGGVTLLLGEDQGIILRNRLRHIGRFVGRDVMRDASRFIDLRSWAGIAPRLIGPKGEVGRHELAWRDVITRLVYGQRLSVLDTVSRFHAADENSNGEMTQLIQILEGIVRETGCAIIIPHHTGKLATLKGLGAAQQAARGASSLTDSPRWQANILGLSEAEAEQFAIPVQERWRYVRLTVPKCNAGPRPSDIWLQRGDGGVLRQAQLTSVPTLAGSVW